MIARSIRSIAAACSSSSKRSHGAVMNAISFAQISYTAARARVEPQPLARGPSGIAFAVGAAMMIHLALARMVQDVDPGRVDRAIDEGAKYLVRRFTGGTLNPKPRGNQGGGPGDEDLLKDELVLYTLVYAGYDESNADFA